VPSASGASSSPAKCRNPVLALLLVTVATGAPAEAQLTPPATGGAAELDLVLQRLTESRRLLVVGAHPDDEDTELLARAVRGSGADAAYLSLTRGDGGQNLLGSELGVELGLLRSRELEAARRTDGARQFVTRAYDFGYTRSLEETLERWPYDSILKDAVRVVRRFRPHVIVSVFSGTSRDGHGQHQMAGRIAHDVYEVAADPERFPELKDEEGLAPWSALKLYRSTRFRPEPTSQPVPTGGLDPRDGRTYHQIAMASRSMHASQDMGRIQDAGPDSTSVGLVDDRTGRGADSMFAGVPQAHGWLAAVADSLRRSVGPAVLPSAVGPLNAALARWRREDGDLDRDTLLARAIVTAAGVVADVRIDAERVTPGATLRATVQVHNSGPHTVQVDTIRLVLPPGWPTATDAAAAELGPGAELLRTLTGRVPEDAEPDQPYFLRAARIGDLYDWSPVSPETRGLLFAAPRMVGEVVIRVAGGPALAFRREATYRFGDQAAGEIRRPVTVVPRLSLRLEPSELVWSLEGAAEHELSVTVTNMGAGPAEGTVTLSVEGWGDEHSARFALEREGDSRRVTFAVRRPPGAAEGVHPVRAVAVSSDGSTFDWTVEQIEYPHVRPTQWLRRATGQIRLVDLVLPEVSAIGYVRGASDRVPEALEEIGLPIRILGEAELAGVELSVFDVIVVGPRAYETDSALMRHNDRLLAYVRNGGHLVVQYQQYQFNRGSYAPFSLAIARPNARVTDEQAPVRVLEPEHPVFRTPNRIAPRDWEGWVQERGLYFAGEWDERYRPLLEMSDATEPSLKGALLVTSYGEGTYAYTGVSFFRSIPAGVPGAFRLFLNLLAWRG
jgi:LmbE family N-acetylglucosaminyl deacetylase